MHSCSPKEYGSTFRLTVRRATLVFNGRIALSITVCTVYFGQKNRRLEHYLTLLLRRSFYQGKTRLFCHDPVVKTINSEPRKSSVLASKSLPSNKYCIRAVHYSASYCSSKIREYRYRWDDIFPTKKKV